MKNQSNCVFCHLYEYSKDKVLREDQNWFIFEDMKNGGAQRHILVCPKNHIVSVNDLNQLEHLNLLDELLNQQLAAENFLAKENPGQQYKFGYHKPPYFSVRHLHLHGLVLPIKNCYNRYVKYGCFLHSTQAIKNNISSKCSKYKKIDHLK